MGGIRSTFVGALVLAAACGGNAFTAGGGGDGGGSGGDSGGRADGAGPSEEAGLADASPAQGAGVRCGPGKTCAGTTPVCCAGATFDCAHVQCGCTTQVECGSNADCGGLVPFCCINQRPPDVTCSNNHFVARCETACNNGAAQMCDPSAPTNSCINAQCSSDSGDLANEGLPASAGYGICK